MGSHKKRTLAAIKPLLEELIDIFDGFEQEQDDPCLEDPQSPACLIQLLRQDYGVIIDANNLTLEQLQLILAAIQTTADRLAELAQGECACEAAHGLSAAQVFQKAYRHQKLHIRWNPNENQFDPPQRGGRIYTTVDNDTIPNQQILTLTPDAFTQDQGTAAEPTDPDRIDPDSQRNPYPREIVERIIIHELGHVFHNNLLVIQGKAVNYQFTNPDVMIREITRTNLRGEEVPTALVVTILRIVMGDVVFTNMEITMPLDTPMVVVDYLIETGGYWTGTVGLDYGEARDSAYNSQDAENDATIVTLTNHVYEAAGLTLQACDSNCNLDEYLVDSGGNCLRDASGNCLAPSANHPNKIYVRQPGVYIALNYTQITDSRGTYGSYFSNERGTTSKPGPKEGFADTFSLYILEGAELAGTQTASADPRLHFFESNFCHWLCQLLS